MPTFAEMAERYLAEDTGHLSTRVKQDRKGYFKAEAPLMPHFASRLLDEITAGMLREWWGLEIESKGRSPQTGRHHINAMAAVFDYAKDLGILEESPVPAFRQQLRRRSRTKRGRAEATPGRKVNPIEDPEEFGRLAKEAEAEGPSARVLVLIQLDAGLRLAEALGLRWGAIVWGEDEDDRSRLLEINQSKPSGVSEVEGTK